MVRSWINTHTFVGLLLGLTSTGGCVGGVTEGEQEPITPNDDVAFAEDGGSSSSGGHDETDTTSAPQEDSGPADPTPDPDDGQPPNGDDDTGNVEDIIEIVADINPLDFGPQLVDTPTELPIVLTNASTIAVTLKDVKTREDSAYDVLNETCEDAVLLPNDTCTEIITFSPDDEETFEGILEVSLEDLDDVFEIDLIGIGVEIND